LHGAQSKADLNLPPGQKPVPMTYYARDGGMARAIASVKSRLRDVNRNVSFGVVGLGAGSLVCYREANENWTTFEINPDVVEVARNPKLFNFLDRCGAGVPILVGDARLTMRDEKSASYDALVIDAFSSDSIPVHLLTTQAMQLYFRLLRDDGILILHISNRYMDLSSVIAANSDSLAPFEGEIFAREIFHVPHPTGFSESPSKVIVLSRSKAAIAAVDQNPDAKILAAAPAGMLAWTDDYSDVLGVILRSLRR
jgi:SAM-dependent methyltransferase